MVVAYATCSPPQLERAKLYLRKGDAPLGDCNGSLAAPRLIERQVYNFRMEVQERGRWVCVRGA